MITKFDVGTTVLVPMEVTKIDINRKSEITYKLECKSLDSSKKEKDIVIFMDESGINSKLDPEVEEPVVDDSESDGSGDNESEKGEDTDESNS